MGLGCPTGAKTHFLKFLGLIPECARWTATQVPNICAARLIRIISREHQYLYDGVEEGERGDDDEVVDAALEGELLPEAAHRDGHRRHEPRQPDEGDRQAAPAVLRINWVEPGLNR